MIKSLCEEVKLGEGCRAAIDLLMIPQENHLLQVISFFFTISQVEGLL